MANSFLELSSAMRRSAIIHREDRNPLLCEQLVERIRHPGTPLILHQLSRRSAIDIYDQRNFPDLVFWKHELPIKRAAILRLELEILRCDQPILSDAPRLPKFVA